MKSTEQTNTDHIVDRGHVSMSHYNKVQKPMSIPRAMESPATTIAMVKDWDTWRIKQLSV